MDKFTKACETKVENNEVYIQLKGTNDWKGPYKNTYDAYKYFRMVFFV